MDEGERTEDLSHIYHTAFTVCCVAPGIRAEQAQYLADRFKDEYKLLNSIEYVLK